MAELSHSSKKKINRVATFPRRINVALNQEFVDTRLRLSHISDSLKDLKRSIMTTRQTWNTVVRQQRDFTARLSSSFPRAGEVSTHAREVEVAMRDVQRELILNDGEASPHYRIMDVIDRYQELLRGIEKEYRPIQLLCTEKMRYERKVDSLEKRTGFRKNPDRLQRNLEKLADARNALETKVNATVRRMRAAFQKHDAVLQCAHHAFWMANNTYLATIEEATRDVRVESVNVHKLLMDIEVDDEKQLMPIPRRHLIEGTRNHGVEDEEREEHILHPTTASSPEGSDVRRITVRADDTTPKTKLNSATTTAVSEEKKEADDLVTQKDTEKMELNTVITSESESESESSGSVDRISFESQENPTKPLPSFSATKLVTPAVPSTNTAAVLSESSRPLASA